MAKAHPARKEIIEIICTTYDILEGSTGTNVNSTNFLNNTKNMSDEQFFDYIKGILIHPKRHFYFEVELFEREIRFEDVEKANDYTNALIFDYIVFPHLSPDPKNPVCTIHKIFNGNLNIRRVQQMVNKKNSLPTNMGRIDPKTGQVTGESKAAKVSDLEMYALRVHDTPNILKEYFTFRSGDPVAKQEALHNIATKGSVSLNELTLDPKNRTALNTANVMLLGAAIETNLITSDGILPRTFDKQFSAARGLSRDKTK